MKLKTSTYEYCLDEQHRNKIRQQAEKDALVRMAKGERSRSRMIFNPLALLAMFVHALFR